MTIKDITCKKCGNNEQVYVEVEQQLGPGKFSFQNSFYCKSCDKLSVIDSVKERLWCKHCHSGDITKFFPMNKVRCSKCGQQAFNPIAGVEF